MTAEEKNERTWLIILSALWTIGLPYLLFTGLFIFGANNLFDGNIWRIGFGMVLVLSYLSCLFSVPIGWVLWLKGYYQDIAPMIATLMLGQFFLVLLIGASMYS